MFDPDDYELHEAQKHACKMAKERDEARVIADRLTTELDKCAAALPGAYYMDPPDGGDVSVSEQLMRMAQDAERYRLLRRKFAIISDGEGHAEFCAINLPRPTYIAPSSAIELDTALDRERLGLDGARPPTPTGWSDTDWIKHLQEQKEPHPLAGLHINQGSMDAAADAYEAEYNAARMLEALKAAAQFVETEQFPIGWSVDRIREVIAKVSGTTPNSACTDTPPDAALAAEGEK